MARRSRQPQQTGRRSVTAPLAGKPKSQSGGEPSQRKGGLRGVRNFAGEVRGELAKVDFPNRQQTWQSTSVVIGACIIVGIYLYGLDQAFTRLVAHLVDLQKNDGNKMFRWYVINTYSGHENKVKANLEHRVKSMNQELTVRRVVVPTESVVETKDGQKVQTERRLWPGYVLVNMDLTDEAWTLVKNTPGVTGFVGAQNKPVPLSQPEVDRMLHTAAAAPAPKQKAEFSLGESVKVISGPLSDFDGEIAEINEDQGKLKVLVSIFERQVPVELEFDKVKKI